MRFDSRGGHSRAVMRDSLSIESLKRPLVLYHAGCEDGFAAAWVLHRVLPNAEFRSTRYNEELPPVDGRDVFLLDISFERDIMVDIADRAESVSVLDHHESALERIPDPYPGNVILDLKRSGAMIAWDEFGQGDQPWFIPYVQDYDLWKFELQQSEAINLAIASFPKEFEAWDEILELGPDKLAEQGEILLRYRAGLIGAVTCHARIFKEKGYTVSVLNSSILQSDIGEACKADNLFVAIWHSQEDGRVKVNLRSHRTDVAKLAQMVPGGGGHRCASGFTIPVHEQLESTLLAMMRAAVQSQQQM